MSKIYSIKIRNYKGIKNYGQVFWMTDIIFITGRRGTGKTSILNGIYRALSPNSNLSFTYRDFFKEDTSNDIEIEVTIFKFPFDLSLDCSYNYFNEKMYEKSNLIYKEIKEEYKFKRTIKLLVKKDYKPKWFIVDRNIKETVEINNSDREKVNILYVSVRDDGHYTWNKEKGIKKIISEKSFIKLLKHCEMVLIDDIELSQNSENLHFLLKTYVKLMNGQVFITSHSHRIFDKLQKNGIFVTKI